MDMNRRIPPFLLMLVFVSACATPSAAGNYAVKYRMSGAATETGELNRLAEASFRAEAPEDERSSAVRVFIDSVPPMLVVADGVVSAQEKSDALLLGSVQVSSKWRVPSEKEVLPALQRAAHSASADVAFCPRSEMREGLVWHCYLVRTTPVQASPSSTTL